ncbi:MAG: flagellar filament capping protein FliD [Gallionella sp.]
MVTTTSSTAATSLDVNSIVTQLMTVEQQPLTKLDTKEASYQAKLSAYGTIKGAVSSFQTALSALNSSSFQAYAVSSSDSSYVSASAFSTAAPGTYAVNVTSLAKSQSLVAAGKTSSTVAIGAGTATTISFDFGTISGGTLNNGIYSNASFTTNGNTIRTITVDSGNNTLQGIRDAINAANLGVSASIVNDGSANPYRLVLNSTSTGASNSLKITSTGDAAIGTLLDNDPAGTQHLTETVAASNAVLTVNGITITKDSNTVSDAIQGVTLNLNKLTTAPLTLNVTRDTGTVSNAISGFVKAYNDLNTTLANLTAYNATSKTGALLIGDATVRTLQFQLRNQLSNSVSGTNTYSTLSSIGVTFQKDGSLALDAGKLSTAIANNFSDIGTLFTSAGGYATTLGTWTSNVLASNGSLTSVTNGINKNIDDIGKQRTALQARLVTTEARYRAQFTALDQMLTSMNNTQTYMTQQITAMQNWKLN